jgi:hypothetical protein
MVAASSPLYSIVPGGSAYWEFGAARRPKRFGIKFQAESLAPWRYRGFLSTFIATAPFGNQIFPELAIGAVWYPTTGIVLPDALICGSLLFRSSRRAGEQLNFFLFYDEALD